MYISFYIYKAYNLFYVSLLRCVGWGWVRLVRRPGMGLLNQPRMLDDDECGAVGGMTVDRGNRSAMIKPVPVSICPPQIPRVELGSNPARRGEKLANNHLSYDKACLKYLTSKFSIPRVCFHRFISTVRLCAFPPNNASTSWRNFTTLGMNIM
jgi:hypothetical protein